MRTTMLRQFVQGLLKLDPESGGELERGVDMCSSSELWLSRGLGEAGWALFYVQ
jgi:hypothetical protein